jgi:hypothetical protein
MKRSEQDSRHIDSVVDVMRTFVHIFAKHAEKEVDKIFGENRGELSGERSHLQGTLGGTVISTQPSKGVWIGYA